MSWALWITGLPGSGKSTIARAVARALEARGERVHVLELDAIRKVVTPRPTYSATERELVYRALVYVAAVLTDAGVPVIIDATAHRRAWRELARSAISRFSEVQLSCPLSVCVERERGRAAGSAPRGIYGRAGRLTRAVPGVDVPYESAWNPEITIDTEHESVDAAVERIVPLAFGLARPTPVRASGVPNACAIWITGLPGSGKTTIAIAVAESLMRNDVPVKVLHLADVEALVTVGRAGDETHDVVHRTLACAAAILTARGIPVIIDATAPRRAWRELARDLVDRFAEVQILCPIALCAERERATRWGLGESRTPAHDYANTTWPEIVLDYEYSINPDLIVRTDVQHASSAARDVLRLAERLLRGAAPLAKTS